MTTGCVCLTLAVFVKGLQTIHAVRCLQPLYVNCRGRVSRVYLLQCSVVYLCRFFLS